MQKRAKSDVEAKSGERAVLVNNLNVGTVRHDLTSLEETVVVGHDELGEAKLAGEEDLLPAGELELCTTECLLSVGSLLGSSADGQEDLANGDTGGLAKNLAERTTHTLLESISASAGKHLVDADTMPRVNSDSQMEVITTAVDDHVLVGGNAGSLKSLRSDLLLLVADEMDTGGELSVFGLLLTAVVHTNLGVGDTTVEA